MGLGSTFKRIFTKKSVRLSADEELVHTQSHSIIRQLDRCDYIKLDVQENVFLCDKVTEFTKDVDLDTVSICGGYAVFLAGYTNQYGDVDFFCTSKFSYDQLTSRLDAREDKSPTVATGSYQGVAINVIHCPDAISIESILDTFDMTWCRAGIDLYDRCIIVHPEIDSELPIFDADRLVAKNVSKNNFADRMFERYCKYKERRIKPCPAIDGLDGKVYGVLVYAINQSTEAAIPAKVFDNSY